MHFLGAKYAKNVFAAGAPLIALPQAPCEGKGGEGPEGRREKGRGGTGGKGKKIRGEKGERKGGEIGPYWYMYFPHFEPRSTLQLINCF